VYIEARYVLGSSLDDVVRPCTDILFLFVEKIYTPFSILVYLALLFGFKSDAAGFL